MDPAVKTKIKIKKFGPNEMESAKIMEFSMHFSTKANRIFFFCFGIRARTRLLCSPTAQSPCGCVIIGSVEIMLCCKSSDRMKKEKRKSRLMDMRLQPKANYKAKPMSSILIYKG